MKLIRHFYLSIPLLFLLCFNSVNGQGVYIPIDQDYSELLDRYEILSNQTASEFHTSVKPYNRKFIAEFIDSVQLDSSQLSSRDRYNIQYLKNDNWEWSNAQLNEKPLLKTFYKRPSGLFTVDIEDFVLQVNPVIYFSAGKDFDDEKLFLNTRGAEIRGVIAEKVGFYAFMADNQGFFPGYVDQYISRTLAVPQEGYTKNFKDNGYDFVTARGYITFSPVKFIDIQFGHDRNFIGDGYRSLILSDFASNYTFLKINTHVWKVNYQNIFGELNADVYYLNDLLPKKYLAFHHLSVNIGKHLNVGLFESVIFSRGDSGRGQYDIGYLNPIIFYRSIEQQLGSEDNALLGLNWKWNFLSHFSFYGQVVLDEFLLSHIRAQDGWWANKQSGQLGLKYINVAGIKNLDLQVEANIIRPYMYSHESKQKNYAHYNHSLAHPLGANLYEVLGIVRYQPIDKLRLTGKIFHTIYGADGVGENWGGDILNSYETREMTFDNKIGQGYKTNINYLSLTASWQVYHNLFVDIAPVLRISKSDLPSMDRTDKFITASLRWNMPQRLQEF